MATPNLATVDLNLLVVFEALLIERNVSRAAGRVGLARPSVSNALARLRALFSDSLFIRTPRGMRPTPRALELAEPIVSALLLIARPARQAPAANRSGRRAGSRIIDAELERTISGFR
jgi:DNA-binding transcriptional LysR family regulator